MNRIRLLVIFFCVMTLLSCSPGLRKLERKGVTVHTAHQSIDLKQENREISLLYLGCGGLYLRQGESAILFDPFFSNPTFFELGKSMLLGGRIRSKPSAIALGKTRIRSAFQIIDNDLQHEVKAIFSAHGHYDHLMDIPFVFQYWFDKNPVIYANESSCNTIHNAVSVSKLCSVDSMLSTSSCIGKYIDLPGDEGKTFRVFPILADHNPHVSNIKFFDGALESPLRYYRKPTAKTFAQDWLEGRTLSFLVDVLKNDEIEFRIFIQSSSCAFPAGMPPDLLLEKKKIDVAVLGVASYHFSERTYPCTYLCHLNPSYTVFIHWENFFRNYKRKPRAVPATDIPAFVKQINDQCPIVNFSIPAPGTRLTVKY